MVIGAEHAHGGKERQAYATCPVEPAQQEDRLAGNLFDAPGRHGNAGLGGKGQGNGLPPDRVDLIALMGKFATARWPSRSRTEALGRAPPRDEPGASRRRRTSHTQSPLRRTRRKAPCGAHSAERIDGRLVAEPGVIAYDHLCACFMADILWLKWQVQHIERRHGVNGSALPGGVGRPRSRGPRRGGRARVGALLPEHRRGVRRPIDRDGLAVAAPGRGPSSVADHGVLRAPDPGRSSRPA